MQVKTYLISEGVKYTETIIEDGYINKIYKVDNCRKDIYAIPETNCQGLFNQIHKKGARSTVWLLTPRLTDYIFPFSRSLQRYA